MTRDAFRKAALWSVAVPSAITGLWALLAPSSWYENFPGLGLVWLPETGAYNEHFARDYGGALFALAVLLVLLAVAPRTKLAVAAPVAYLVWAVPHLVYHVANLEQLSTGDNVVNLAILAGSVAVPALLLVQRGGARPSGRRVPASAAADDGRRLPDAPARGLVRRSAYAYSRRNFGHVLGTIGVHAHHRDLLAGYGAYELAIQRSHTVDERLKDLAVTRAAMLVGCEFCIDMSSGILERLGVSEEKLLELPRWRESDAFSGDERLALDYAEALTATPPTMSDELWERLRARFDDPQLVELTVAIAIENYRARVGEAFGLASEGFSKTCAVPGAMDGAKPAGARA
jgi:AhpD family alkylhydroperoxidase